MKRTRLAVERTWDGQPVLASERVEVWLSRDADGLGIDFDAPFHGDPEPPGPPGSFDGLWEYEVVEVFLLGDGQHYLEIELGPHGHYLVLCLRGPRNVIESGLTLEYTCDRSGGRWSGRASVPAARLPAGLRAANAYAIHGTGSERRYLAAHPVPGPEPDFHRLEHFAPLPPALAD